MSRASRIALVGVLAVLGPGCGAGAAPGTTTPTPESDLTELEPAADTGEPPTDVDQTDAGQTAALPTDVQRTDTQVEGTEPPRSQQTGMLDAEHGDGPNWQPAPPSSSEPPAVAGIRAQLTIYERQAGELEQIATLVAEARRLAQANRVPIPPLCEDRQPIEALRILGTRGGAGSSSAISAVQALEVWCARFELWSHPDERLAHFIESYFQHLDRITGWMRDIQRCEGTAGAERARCENAYSGTTRVESDEASRILTLLDEHRRELAGVQAGAARFPCTTPVLMRIESASWVGATARAQMTNLPREADGVCHSMGVSERALREASRDLGRSLDQAESSVRSQRRSALEAIEALRPVLE